MDWKRITKQTYNCRMVCREVLLFVMEVVVSRCCCSWLVCECSLMVVNVVCGCVLLNFYNVGLLRLANVVLLSF